MTQAEYREQGEEHKSCRKCGFLFASDAVVKCPRCREPRIGVNVLQAEPQLVWIETTGGNTIARLIRRD